MATKDVIQTAVDRYLAVTDALDPGGYAAIFAPDAAFYDPPGQPPLIGREAILERVVRSFGGLRQAHTTVDQIFIAGDSVAYAYRSVLTAKNGRSVTIGGIDAFEINADGLIQVARFYWDPTPLRAMFQG